MLALLSPAKKLDTTPLPAARQGLVLSTPQHLADAATLAAVAKRLSAADIAGLMDLSESLAELNWDRFQVWKKDHILGENDAKPAALTFAGDVYSGLEAPTLSDADLTWMNQRLLILSGLYGTLRPLDLMQPYRLEMGSKLANKKGPDLYSFWGDKLARTIDQALADHPERGRVVLNLASNEYFKAVSKKALKAPVIDVAFKEIKQGKPVMLMLFAKRARGMMARYMVTNRIEDPNDLKGFDLGTYRFDAAASSERSWVFTRPYRTAASSD